MEKMQKTVGLNLFNFFNLVKVQNQPKWSDVYICSVDSGMFLHRFENHHNIKPKTNFCKICLKLKNPLQKN